MYAAPTAEELMQAVDDLEQSQRESLPLSSLVLATQLLDMAQAARDAQLLDAIHATSTADVADALGITSQAVSQQTSTARRRVQRREDGGGS